jgi:hypothetical protein
MGREIEMEDLMRHEKEIEQTIREEVMISGIKQEEEIFTTARKGEDNTRRIQ